MIIYINGRYLPEDEVFISPFDHGFLYGMGLFETLRIYDGHPFLLNDHISRLQDGLRDMFINVTVSIEEISDILQELLEINNIKHARVRINVSAASAPGPISLPAGPYELANVMVFISPLEQPAERVIQKKARVLQTRRNTPENLIRHKSHHFGNNVIAKMELGNDLNMEGLFLTEEGIVSEAITSNVFWVKGGVLYTPCKSTGILPGITRQFIMMLAKMLNIVVQEGCYQLSEIAEADEVFLTNSVQEMVAINEIDKVGRFQGRDGEITNMLFKEFKHYRTSLWTSGTLT